MSISLLLTKIEYDLQIWSGVLIIKMFRNAKQFKPRYSYK